MIRCSECLETIRLYNDMDGAIVENFIGKSGCERCSLVKVLESYSASIESVRF